MNFELKNIKETNYYVTDAARRIKLRKSSFSNVNDSWVGFYDAANSEISNDINDSTINVVNNTGNIDIPEADDVIKLPIAIPNLNDSVFLLDIDWNSVSSIKRRALSLSSVMFLNVCNNVKKSYDDDSLDDSTAVDEEEIKQAVRDAFQQIRFKNTTNDIVITPEEVNDTVELSNVSYSENANDDSNVDTDKDDLVNTSSSSGFDKDTASDAFDDPTFKFDSIDFSKINYGDDPQDSTELQDLLNRVKQLKLEKDEQDKKTQDAVALAQKKEKEKDEVKARFIAYQTSIEEELNKSRKVEEENLEKAREAEKFTSALVDVMNH